MSAYADWLPTIAPAWLQGKRGTAFLRAMGQSFDATADRLRTATKVRYVATGPDDVLDSHAHDRLLERYPAQDNPALRTYLRAAWTTWAGAGTYGGIVAALEAAGFPECRVYDVWSVIAGGTGAPSWWPGGSGAWPPAPTYAEPSWWAAYAASASVSTTWPPAAGSDAGRALWSRWWLEVPGLPEWSQRVWGTANLWRQADLWGLDGATPDELALLRRVVRKFRASAGPCELIFVRLDGDTRITSDGSVRVTSDGSIRTTAETLTVVLAGA